ncbi:MAG TPA: peptidoglycan DD-metalloendopeptidase family protein [Prolixibacteraceae bacterium]|nr:peptidoglycan DD-metalloendopeptidase family protein [Prolixibacteraceae bacterium]
MNKRKIFWITGLVIIALIVFLTLRFNRFYQKLPPLAEDIVITVPEPKLLYGLPADSFHIEESTVERNQNLSDILIERGVTAQAVDQLAKNSVSVFDVRKMKTGNQYTIFYSKDEARSPLFLAYQNNSVDYYLYSLTDSLKVTAGKHDVTSKRQTMSGVISSSLWNAMKESNINPILAVELSDIYAWTIDFFAIQKGDQFTVIFDEDFVNGESIGLEKIYSASFTQGGDIFYAIRFTQEDGDSFFDEKGNSLRKAFLKAPLKFSRISSRFSNHRMHPVLRIVRPHHGVDYAAATGTPVVSIGDGVVIQKSYQAAGGGNYVKIKHNSVYTTSYMHLSKFASGLRAGTRVKQGEVIGYVGSTGLASGPHLDFRVYIGGTAVDPLKIKSEPAEPVKPANLGKFNTLRDSVLQILKVKAI